MKNFLIAALVGLLIVGDVDAQKGGSGSSSSGSRSGGSSSSGSSSSGSRSSGSSSSGSKYGSSSSQGSKGSSSSSSQGSKGGSSSQGSSSKGGSSSSQGSQSKGGSSSSNSKGSSSQGSPSKGGSSSSQGNSKGGSNSKGSADKGSSNDKGSSKYSSSNGKDSGSKSIGDSAKQQVLNNGSKKPASDKADEKARANREEASKKSYETQAKATAPPKSSYTTPSGHEVKIDPKSKVVTEIRNKPSNYYEPAVRNQRINVHVTQYHYAHPYNYYYTQPYFYVGGGYSSCFWWMMMEWDAERRAYWFYHNRDSIERSAYERGMQDAAVARRIAELEAAKTERISHYVDPEFKNNTTDMYDQDYIEAAYNPVVVHHGHSLWTSVLWIAGISALVYLVFFRKSGE